MKNISIIAACDTRGGFAKDHTIPWINEAVGKLDLKNFQKITTGHSCVMGVNTYNEIYDIRKTKVEGDVIELLPGRKCYVVSSNTNRVCSGATVVSSLRAARQILEVDTHTDTLFVIGGRRLFIEAVAWAESVYLTVINNDYDCDQFLPLNTINKKFRTVTIDKQDGITFVHYVRHTLS